MNKDELLTNSKVPTAHNTAKSGDFAKTVLMPGDPLRAKYIADNFLSGAVLVNNVRGVNGYTGFYKGKRVSVMASGMGIPSISIYSYELFNFYDVSSIIRVGSAGAIDDRLKIMDIVLAQGACTDSNIGRNFALPGVFAPIADYGLLSKAYETAVKVGANVKVGNVLSSDVFYDDSASTMNWQKMGVLAVEMEAAGLYMNAARAGKKALCIATISDCLYSGEACNAETRQKGFTQMMEIALEVAEE
ncbi:MAG: purine-nucleoside phosphorylase [Clostridia bacterium]|nr:purine-nucleoside phosphorylase [Clostridia bacterium]